MHALGGGGGGVFSRLELFEDVGEFGVGSIGARALAAEVVGDARGLAAGLGGGGELDGARHRELGLGGGGGFLGGGELGGGLGGGALGDGARGLSLLGAREKLVVSASILLPFFTAPASLARYDSAFSSAARAAASWSLIASVEIEHRWAARGKGVRRGRAERARENFHPKLLPSARPSEDEDSNITSPRAPMPILSPSSAVARLARELRTGTPARRASPTRVDPRAPRSAGRAPTTIVASLS